MKQYVDLMLKVQHYLHDDVITVSGESEFDDENVDDGGWTQFGH